MAETPNTPDNSGSAFKSVCNAIIFFGLLFLIPFWICRGCSPKPVPPAVQQSR